MSSNELSEIDTQGESQKVYFFARDYAVKVPKAIRFEEELQVALTLHILGHQRFSGLAQVERNWGGPRRAYTVERVWGATVAEHMTFFRSEASKLGIEDPYVFYPPLFQLTQNFKKIQKALFEETSLRDVSERNVIIDRTGRFVLIDAILHGKMNAAVSAKRLRALEGAGAWKRNETPQKRFEEFATTRF